MSFEIRPWVPFFRIFQSFCKEFGFGTPSIEISGSTSPRGLIESPIGWKRHMFMPITGFCQVRPVRFSKMFNAFTRNPVSGPLPWKSAGRNLPGVLSRHRLDGQSHVLAKHNLFWLENILFQPIWLSIRPRGDLDPLISMEGVPGPDSGQKLRKNRTGRTRQ